MNSATCNSTPRGSELLFQIPTEHEEKSNVAVASKLPFSEWDTVIPDPSAVRPQAPLRLGSVRNGRVG